VPIGQRSF